MNKTDLKKIFIPFAIWLVAVNLFGVIALNRFNLKSDTAYTWISPEQFSQTHTWNILAPKAHWDSGWYIDVARHGYYLREQGQLANIPFFPLYPLLVRAASIATLGNIILAGWILSTLFLGAALYYIYKLVKEFHPEVDPQTTLVFLLVFPLSFFLNAVYAESLFLFLSVTTFYYALKKNFLLAGVLGFLAALTRVSGAFLFIPILIEYIQSRKGQSFFHPTLGTPFLIPLGTITFFFHHYLQFGNFFIYFDIQKLWGRSFALNKDHFLTLTHPATINLVLDTLFVVTMVAALYFIFKKFHLSYGVYGLFTLLVPLSTGTFISIGRYILVFFPLFIYLASIKNVYVKQAYVLFSVLLLGMYLTLFVNNYWAG